MIHESIVGIFAGLFQKPFQFFQRQPKIVSDRSPRTSLSIGEEPDGELVVGKQGIAGFTLPGPFPMLARGTLEGL